MRAILIGLAISLGVPASTRAKMPRDEALAALATEEFDAGLRNKHRILLARQHFTAAADAYFKLHEAGNRNADLYRSLGNALTLADRWPEAIWAYQMGLTFAPDDATMRRHLAELRAKVLLPPDGQGRLPADRWPAFLPRLTVRKCWWLSIGSYLLVCVALVAWQRFRTRRAIGLIVAGSVATIVFTVAFWFAMERQRSDLAIPVAVVIENTPFRKGNGAAYPQHAIVPTLARGLETRILHKRGDWLQIALSTDEIGWLPTTAVRIVEP